MNKSMLSEQMNWYLSQPTSYRRMWWEWAKDQPNFRAMYEWAQVKEQDESVRRAMMAWASRKAK